jgi:hypothetical protein
MADNPILIDAALTGQLVSVSLLAKLVDRGLISVADAIDVLDGALEQLEEWQGGYVQLFPEYQQAFEFARDFLLRSINSYRAIQKKPPD